MTPPPTRAKVAETATQARVNGQAGACSPSELGPVAYYVPEPSPDINKTDFASTEILLTEGLTCHI